MPSLTLERETPTPDGRETDPAGAAGEPGDTAGETAGVAGEPGGYDHDPRATGRDSDDDRRGASAAGRRRAGRRDTGTSTGYSRFSFKTEPPRIDPTQGGAPREERRETERSGGDRHRERSEGGGSLEDVLFSRGSELMSYEADVDRVVEKLYREIERKMRIERERRGL